MIYYSTSNQNHTVTLQEAVMQGIADDGGLFMPEKIPVIPKAFFSNMKNMSLHDIAYVISNYAMQGDMESSELKRIVHDTINYDIPLNYIADNRYILELFHGPTMAFKDLGARFMGRLMGYFNTIMPDVKRINVLVATSGSTGGAVANGLLNVPGVHVYLLYPSGKVTAIQEAQMATLGQNITPIAVNGTIDDCKELVNRAFADQQLRHTINITMAKSANIARILPQMVPYFYAYAQLAAREQPLDNIVVAVPCGNLGNITAGLFAKRMGLPIKRFIAVENVNNTLCRYLATSEYEVKPLQHTIAYAMDVNKPRNFPRITHLYNSHMELCADVTGVTVTEQDIVDTIRNTYNNENYLLDPHGAAAYYGLMHNLQPGETGIALETAHPALFAGAIEPIIGKKVEMPVQLQSFMQSKVKSVKLTSGYTAFKNFLLSTQ